MPLLHKGQKVGSGSDEGRWQVVRKLGEGQFAEVYEVRDTQHQDKDARFAMKVEKRLDARSIKQEYRVMKRLSEHCPQICPVLHFGQLQHDRFFMVMQLLTSNLVELRRNSPGGRLAPNVLRHVASSMLDALQAVHAAGFVHRDIKPANFSQVPPGSASAGEWWLLDFGLARRYTDQVTGAVLPPRPDAAFRGSTAYASVHAHAGSDLSRRDDLWSWLYCVVELAEGTLPWRQADGGGGGRDADGAGGGGGGGGADKHRHAAAAAKQMAINNPERLARVTPITGLVSSITSHLTSLQFPDPPDYGLLRRILSTHIPDIWPHMPPPPLPLTTAASAPDVTMQGGAITPSAVTNHTHHTTAPGRPPILSTAAKLAGVSSASATTSGLLLTSPQQQGGEDGAKANASRRALGNADQQQQHASQPVGGEGAHTGGGVGDGGVQDANPSWCAPPPPGTREASAVFNMSEYIGWLQGGAAGRDVERLASEVSALHPVDGLAVVAAVLGAAVVCTPASQCHALAALLSDVSLYTGHVAQQAAQRFVEWQEGQVTGVGVGGGQEGTWGHQQNQHVQQYQQEQHLPSQYESVQQPQHQHVQQHVQQVQMPDNHVADQGAWPQPPHEAWAQQHQPPQPPQPLPAPAPGPWPPPPMDMSAQGGGEGGGGWGQPPTDAHMHQPQSHHVSGWPAMHTDQMHATPWNNALIPQPPLPPPHIPMQVQHQHQQHQHQSLYDVNGVWMQPHVIPPPQQQQHVVSDGGGWQQPQPHIHQQPQPQPPQQQPLPDGGGWQHPPPLPPSQPPLLDGSWQQLTDGIWQQLTSPVQHTLPPSHPHQHQHMHHQHQHQPPHPVLVHQTHAQMPHQGPGDTAVTWHVHHAAEGGHHPMGEEHHGHMMPTADLPMGGAGQ